MFLAQMARFVRVGPDGVVWSDPSGIYKFAEDKVQEIMTFPVGADPWLTRIRETKLGPIYYATRTSFGQLAYLTILDGQVMYQSTQPFLIDVDIDEYYREILRRILRPALPAVLIRYVLRATEERPPKGVERGGEVQMITQQVGRLRTVTRRRV